jgi:hypothetical protein
VGRGAKPSAGARGQVDAEDAAVVEVQVNMPSTDSTVFDPDI